MSDKTIGGCTCRVAPPRHEFARFGHYGRSVYVDERHDPTRFDPACRFHGDNGTMVARLSRKDRPS